MTLKIYVLWFYQIKQQRSSTMSENTQQLAEHKLIILHLVQNMGIPLANSEIC